MKSFIDDLQFHNSKGGFLMRSALAIAWRDFANKLFGGSDYLVVKAWIGFVLCDKQVADNLPVEQVRDLIRQLLDVDREAPWVNREHTEKAIISRWHVRDSILWVQLGYSQEVILETWRETSAYQEYVKQLIWRLSQSRLLPDTVWAVTSQMFITTSQTCIS